MTINVPITLCGCIENVEILAFWTSVNFTQYASNAHVNNFHTDLYGTTTRGVLKINLAWYPDGIVIRNMQ